MPDPYIKQPQPYPPSVRKEYDAYKQYSEKYSHADARYKQFNSQKYGRNIDREKWTEGLALARQARTVVN
jgi:hypothetical protein